MKDIKAYVDILLKYLETESSKGRNLINIKQQKKGSKNSFKIHPIYKNGLIHSINTERSTLPNDTVIPLKVFEIVIQSLIDEEKNSYTLVKGKPLAKTKIGQPGLEESTLEAIVAMKFYEKKKGDSVYRRIPAISNILSEAGICENIRSGSRLKLIVD